MSPNTTPSAERAIAPMPPETGAAIRWREGMDALVVVIVDPILWTFAVLAWDRNTDIKSNTTPGP